MKKPAGVPFIEGAAAAHVFSRAGQNFRIDNYCAIVSPGLIKTSDHVLYFQA